MWISVGALVTAFLFLDNPGGGVALPKLSYLSQGFVCLTYREQTKQRE